MDTDLPSGTVTFLFTDIQGSTKISQALRADWLGLLARHHAILQSAMEMHGGRLFEIVGDGFCVAFQTAGEALEAALEHDIVTGAPYGTDHDVYSLLADAAAQRRDLAALREYAPLAEESARRIDHRLDLAIAHRAWGVAHTLAGEYPQARGRFQQALDLFAAYQAPWQLGRTEYEMGLLAGAEKKTAEARDHFSRALAAFEEMHAAPDMRRTRAALEEIGAG